jgi:hypothetical protein
VGRARCEKQPRPSDAPYDVDLIQSIGLLLIGRGALRTDSALSMRPEATNVSYGHFRSGIPAINCAISNPKEPMATSNSGSVSDPLT